MSTTGTQAASRVAGPVGQIHASVTDIEASVRFYRDVLGLPFLFDVPAQKMAFFDLGDGVRLYLGVPLEEGFRSRPLIYYRVQDVHDAFETVTARGAAALSEPHRVHSDGTTELWLAFVADPDGTPVGLMQERPAPPA